MAFEGHGVKLVGGVAGADLSAKQYYAVKHSSSGLVLAGSGEQIAGILQDKPVLGDPAEVAKGGCGVSKAVVGAAVLKGAELMSNASGKLVTATSTNRIVAYAMEAGGADGDIITVDLVNAGTKA
jgi:hypothetical protein